MKLLSHARVSRTIALGGVLAAAMMGLVSMASPGHAGASTSPQSGVVGTNPADKTPYVLNGTVLSVAHSGSLVALGGTFTQARNFGGSQPTFDRQRVLLFSETDDRLVDTFAPTVDGTVNAVRFSPDGLWVYLGGGFTTVNGVAQRGIAKLSVADGSADPGFAAKLNNGAVHDLEIRGNTLYLGGTFTNVKGVQRGRLAAIDATSGAVLPGLSLTVETSFGTSSPNVRKIDVSPDGSHMVIIGDFRKVGGLSRVQIAVLDLTTSPASVVDWSTTRFTGACASVFSTYMRDVDVAPDGRHFVVVTTGAYRANALCDTASQWDLQTGGSDVQPTWINYQGGDTLLSVETTDAAVYVGGHQRWSNSSEAGDRAAIGGVNRPGIAALDPLTGIPLTWNPTHDRGVGVQALLATPDRLYVGSDTSKVAGEWHPRITAFPYTAPGSPNPQPAPIPLPVQLIQTKVAGGLDEALFDGTTVGPSTALEAPGGPVDWSTSHGVFAQLGKLYYANVGNSLRRADLAAPSGASDDLTTGVYAVSQPENWLNVRATAFSDGRLYFVRNGEDVVRWRWFSLESGIVGSQVFTAAPSGASAIVGMEIAGGAMYFTRNDGRLWSAPVGSGTISLDAAALVDGPADSATDWSSAADFAFAPSATGPVIEPSPCASTEFAATYFPNASLTGPADTTSCDAAVAFDYADGAPEGTTLPVDNFSVVWKTRAVFTGPTADFTVSADDGYRLYLDGQLISDRWNSGGTQTTRVDLAAGEHAVRLEYVERTGNASVALQWTDVAALQCAPGEWTADWYGNRTLSGQPATRRCESTIDYVLGSGSPPGTGVGPDNFSARWTTTLDVVHKRQYQFTVTADDGVRVIVDGTRVIDKWFDHGANTYSTTVELPAGQHTVAVEYYENGGSATIQETTTPLALVTDAVLFVKNANALTSDEQAIASHLQARSIRVTAIDDDLADASVADGYDVAIVGGRVAAPTIAKKLNGTTTPLIVGKIWLYDDLAMTTAISGTGYGTTTVDTVTVTDPNSPLAAGFSGDVPFFTSPQIVGWGVPNSNGFSVASAPAGAVIFGYRPGATLRDGTAAPSCRLGFPLEAPAATALTAQGWAMFDAMVDDALGPACA